MNIIIETKIKELPQNLIYKNVVWLIAKTKFKDNLLKKNMYFSYVIQKYILDSHEIDT
jgi:hypothetical protein